VAMPALKLELEDPVEDRIAILESDVKHIRSDVSDLKTDVRRLNDKMDGMDQRLNGKMDAIDQRLNGKMDAIDQRLNAKIDGVKDLVASQALATEKSFAKLNVGRALDRVWWLLIAASILGVMARGFKWI
jgi:outer membrane murein-binding lipoprotein Lpp